MASNIPNLEEIDSLWSDYSNGFRPKLTLRGGNAIDSLKVPPTYEKNADLETDSYLHRNICGISYLDHSSIRYYVPIFVRHMASNFHDESSVVIDEFLCLISSDRFLDQSSHEEVAALLRFLEFIISKKHSYKLEDIIDKMKHNL